MGIGTSIVLVAIGAILAFAVDASVSGVDLQVVGWILMGAGALGLVLSMIFWSSWGGGRSRRAVIDTAPAGHTRTVVDETN